MNLFIRAHDLGVSGIDNLTEKLSECKLCGVQMVAYKCLPDVKYEVGSISEHKALEIQRAFKKGGFVIPLIGAYFNPVHSDKAKVEKCSAIFRDYLKVANTMGCSLVGSETGSFNDDKWTYHPQNRTDEALNEVCRRFKALAKFAAKQNAEIAIEGAYGHVAFSVKRLRELYNLIDEPNVKIIFDLYNFLAEENVDSRNEILQEGLETFGKKIAIFHLKDCIVDSDGKLKQVAVGNGIFDYNFILTEICKFNKNANLVLEGTTGTDILRSVGFIRQNLSKIESNLK